MEKFQKYCLSFILVILYTNVAAQVNCNVFEDENCKKACEISNKAAEYQGFNFSQQSFDKAIELCPGFDYAYSEKSVPYLKRGDFGKYDKALENFEKQSKVYEFAENIYFKSKISKIRNKDYLDLKNLALTMYDDGKAMKDSYTHHYNKVYRAQIEEL